MTLTTENCSSLCAEVLKKQKDGDSAMADKVEFIVLNKEGLQEDRVKKETQVRIEGVGRKAGDTVKLDPDAHDTKYLQGQGWIELKSQPKPAVELDDDAGSKSKSKGKKK